MTIHVQSDRNSSPVFDEVVDAKGSIEHDLQVELLLIGRLQSWLLFDHGQLFQQVLVGRLLVVGQMDVSEQSQANRVQVDVRVVHIRRSELGEKVDKVFQDLLFALGKPDRVLVKRMVKRRSLRRGQST